jgi:glycosyltransferase involved in cell wall biosynthesis
MPPKKRTYTDPIYAPQREPIQTPIDTLDVLLVTLGSTEGLRVADEELAGSLRRAGAHVAIAAAAHPGEIRTLMLTDLGWARAARRAAREALERLRPTPPRAVIYSTTTAAMLWPLPGAIRFDAPAAANRPGRHGLWQRPLERRRLRQAPLLLPSSEGALAEARAAVPGCEEHALVVPAPVRIPGSQPDFIELDSAERDSVERGSAERDIAAITYAANPLKKGFDRVLEAWRRVRRPSEQLVVTGVTRERLRENGFDVADDDVQIAGPLPQGDYRALLRRARVYVCAPRREEYGIAQLEALAEGCLLVTTPAPGAYVALSLARELDPRLVGEDLGAALRCALDTPATGYAARAAELVEPFTTAAVDRLVAEVLLPRLLGQRGSETPRA